VASAGEKVNREDSWGNCLPKTLHTFSFGIDGVKAEFDGKFKCIVFIMISIPDYFY
jgi:hypothetical protein